MQEKLTKQEIDAMMAFVAAVTEVCKEAGKDYTFPCPICGGKAHAKKDSYNGHRTGLCPICGTKMME